MRLPRDDRGFTLTELMVALGLLGVVLAMAYAGLQVVYKSREVSERQAYFAREISSPLGYLDEVTSQNLSVEAPTAYSARFLTDRNNDDIRERHFIAANADGTLVDEVWLVDSAGVNTSLRNRYVWSEHNANVASNRPLFCYYTSTTTTSAATEITDMSKVPASARTMHITIVTNYEDKYLHDSRDVLFRNR